MDIDRLRDITMFLFKRSDDVTKNHAFHIMIQYAPETAVNAVFRLITGVNDE